MHHQKLILLLTALLTIIALSKGIKVELLKDDYGKLGTKLDFYEEEYQLGLSTTIETTGPCKNLPRRWRGKPQAVDTRGTCGRVCSELDCKGICKHVLPNVGEQMLSAIKMNKKIFSVEGCFNENN